MGGVAAAAGGVIGTVGQFITGQQEARELGAAARAQLGAAQAERAEDLRLRRETREAALRAAEPSPEEIANLQRATAALETDIAAKQRLLDSADPALMEAGRQALQLLQGQEAKTLDPIRRQRQEERQKLEDTLRARLGPGFETSTAGQQALQRFDQGTGDLLTNAQQQSLNSLLGVTQNVRGLASVTGSAQALAGIQAPLAQRRLGAILSTPLTTQFSTAQFAGAPFLEGVLQQRNLGQLFRNIGGMVSMAGAGGGGGGGLDAQQANLLSQINQAPGQQQPASIIDPTRQV